MPDSARESRGVTRREFVTGVTALGAAWFAAAACEQKAGTVATKTDSAPMLGMAKESAAPPQTLLHFTPEQAADMDAMVSRIIPSDDSPGAHEAGVMFFIDRSLTTFIKEQAPLVDEGLKTLAKNSQKKHGKDAVFAKLTAQQQDAILKEIEKTDFFGAMRFATIAGFLSLPKYGGNKDYIGWNFIGQEHGFEHKPPFGWYDRPENQQALLGRVL